MLTTVLQQIVCAKCKQNKTILLAQCCCHCGVFLASSIHKSLSYFFTHSFIYLFTNIGVQLVRFRIRTLEIKLKISKRKCLHIWTHISFVTSQNSKLFAIVKNFSHLLFLPQLLSVYVMLNKCLVYCLLRSTHRFISSNKQQNKKRQQQQQYIAPNNK